MIFVERASCRIKQGFARTKMTRAIEGLEWSWCSGDPGSLRSFHQFFQQFMESCNYKQLSKIVTKFCCQIWSNYTKFQNYIVVGCSGQISRSLHVFTIFHNISSCSLTFLNRHVEHPSCPWSKIAELSNLHKIFWQLYALYKNILRLLRTLLILKLTGWDKS